MECKALSPLDLTDGANQKPVEDKANDPLRLNIERNVRPKCTVVKSLENAWILRDIRERPNKAGSPISWQNAVRDHHMRRTYVDKILKILQKEVEEIMHPLVNNHTHNLPSLARRLEYHIYTESKSLKEYDDTESLQKRLQGFLKEYQARST